MAIDFIIGVLLLVSVLVNILALWAFRITPSLQTRSNSFVVNLLFINVISCIILAVFLIFNSHYIRDILIANYGRPSDEERRYFLDTVATLGALSLTLVICDTHSAITDPLRYHSRLSTLKVWLMIATVWIVGIVFGIGSYFRSNNNLLFTFLFCALIVAAPFCLICAMYWRIFREARENGLRMRQNGSSPLLQSALNLVTGHMGNSSSHPQHHQQYAPRPAIETILEKSPSYAEGLTLKIDDDGHSKLASSAMAVMESTTKSGSGGGGVQTVPQFKSLANLTISRNQSLRQMFLFGISVGSNNSNSEKIATSNHDRAEAHVIPTAECLLNKLNNLQLQRKETVRQVRSTPDLQRYLNPDDGLQNTHHRCLGADHRASVGVEYPFRPIAPSQTPPKHLGYMTSIRHRLSNASSLFKYREESRAARISILVVIMFLVSYIPYGLLLIAADEGFLSHYTQTVLSIFVVVLATIGSPIIFAYRNQRVQRAVKRLLGIRTKEQLPCSSVHSSSTCKSKRLQRTKTISTYKKNLVLKSVPGREIKKLLLAYPPEKCVPVHDTIAADSQLERVSIQNGYENYLEESVAGSLTESTYMQKRNSTTSTTSTIPCDEVGGSRKTVSLLNRFGFIRNQSRNMQKFGVSV